MRQSILKAVFALTVVVLTMVFIVPAYLALELLLPTGRGDRLLPGVIVAYFCVWAANRFTSLFFWRMQLSDERWSVLSAPRTPVGLIPSLEDRLAGRETSAGDLS